MKGYDLYEVGQQANDGPRIQIQGLNSIAHFPNEKANNSKNNNSKVKLSTHSMPRPGHHYI